MSLPAIKFDSVHVWHVLWVLHYILHTFVFLLYNFAKVLVVPYAYSIGLLYIVELDLKSDNMINLLLETELIATKQLTLITTY